MTVCKAEFKIENTEGQYHGNGYGNNDRNIAQHYAINRSRYNTRAEDGIHSE